MTDLDAEIARKDEVIRDLRRRLLDEIDKHDALVEKRENEERPAEPISTPKQQDESEESAG